MKTYKVHPLAKSFPMMEGHEFQSLVDDIMKHGCREPIVIYDGKILDGVNRYRACHEARVEPDFWKFDDGDPRAFVISANVIRRHLDVGQRAWIVATLTEAATHGGKQPSDTGHLTAKELRGKLNVSTTTERHARHVKEDGVTALGAMVKNGQVKVAHAAEVADLPQDKQSQIVAGGPALVTEKAKERRKAKKAAASVDVKAEAKKDPTNRWTKAVTKLHELVSTMPEPETLEQVAARSRKSLAIQITHCKNQLQTLARKVSSWT